MLEIKFLLFYNISTIYVIISYDKKNFEKINCCLWFAIERPQVFPLSERCSPSVTERFRPFPANRSATRTFICTLYPAVERERERKAEASEISTGE